MTSAGSVITIILGVTGILSGLLTGIAFVCRAFLKQQSKAITTAVDNLAKQLMLKLETKEAVAELRSEIAVMHAKMNAKEEK